MSRSRQYARKELETLRRADLQNLYKVGHLSQVLLPSRTVLTNSSTVFEEPTSGPKLSLMSSTISTGQSMRRPHLRPEGPAPPLPDS